MMSSLQQLSPKAEMARQKKTLRLIISDAVGLQELLESNLGPKGTLKMLVSGGGDIKITKDGKTLLGEMQIQSPIAALIARAASSQDDVVGDGTTSAVILVGEVLKRAAYAIDDGIHPKPLSDGIHLARDEAIKYLETLKRQKTGSREDILEVAKTAVGTKLDASLTKLISEMCTDSVISIQDEKGNIDLHRIEIVRMQRKVASESRIIKGLVLDHGARHSGMPSELRNCYVLILNVSLEYEKTEVNSSFLYSTAEQKDKLVQSERAFTDEKVKKIIEFKRKVCKEGESFVIINQKGIDPLSLNLLANEGIIALRRAKRRNMERLQLCCGGTAQNSVDGLKEEYLGFAGYVHQQAFGEEKFTFVEEVKDPKSVTMLIQGQSNSVIAGIVDALRDGLRGIKNFFDDKKTVLPGGGGTNAALSMHLAKFSESFFDKRQIGIKVLSDALLSIPRILAKNSGLDPVETILKLQEGYKNGSANGINLETGGLLDHDIEGVWDTYAVHRQSLESCTLISSTLLIVDGMIKAGRSLNK
eukprot:GHVP01060069.1.p1 GENE.GHVP01060069.1~~GHVP01060069.1.p1  ORF type:complete len:531 (-),score=129.36 GHVP01060069.1:187-1779(-)